MGNYIDASDVYNISGLTDSEIDLSVKTNLIEDSEAEFEALTGRKFTNGNTVTEYLDGGKKDFQDNKKTRIQTSYFPIQSITSFLILNTDGTTNTTLSNQSSSDINSGDYDNTDYWLDSSSDPVSVSIKTNGGIILKTLTFPAGVRNVKIAYTYGYATVPTLVRACVSCIAGIRAWVAFMGGQYNRINSYSIPEQSVDKGDFYIRAKTISDSLSAQAQELLSRIGRRPSIVFMSSGNDR